MLKLDPEVLDRARQTSELGESGDLEGLTQAMNALEPGQRAALVLRYFNELSYDEIARALNVPLGTVKSRINHALKKLRAKMQELS